MVLARVDRTGNVRQRVVVAARRGVVAGRTRSLGSKGREGRTCHRWESSTHEQ